MAENSLLLYLELRLKGGQKVKNIEKRLRYGWNIEDFLQDLDCLNKEELFKFLRKYFSRKTVKGYIKRMEKNPGRKNKKLSLNKNNHSIYVENKNIVQPEIYTINTIEDNNVINVRERRPKEGIMQRIVNFFRRLIR